MLHWRVCVLNFQKETNSGYTFKMPYINYLTQLMFLYGEIGKVITTEYSPL